MRLSAPDLALGVFGQVVLVREVAVDLHMNTERVQRDDGEPQTMD